MRYIRVVQCAQTSSTIEQDLTRDDSRFEIADCHAIRAHTYIIKENAQHRGAS